MTFKEFILSQYDNPSIEGQWGPLHILTLIYAIAIILIIAFMVRNKSAKTRKIVLWVLVGIIMFFELSRRIINFIKMTDWSLNNILYTLLPRPWCAISCWLLMLSPIVNKKWLYNLASFSSLACALVFFAYPGAGFNNKYLEFENIYSIGTHTMILITSISLITMKFTDFKYEGIWKEMVGFACIFLYAFIEIYILKIADDPLYFMPSNDVQDILGLEYMMYLFVYILFFTVYINLFYLINERKRLFRELKFKRYKYNYKSIDTKKDDK